jgi:cytochrome c biogenesis protein CcmG/thiol:disulfide interchange protein DsbE
VLLAICVIVPVALLIVATRGNGNHDSSSNGATVHTSRGLVSGHVVTNGDRAPTFRLRTLDGPTLDTATYRGRPYIVTFWGSWCIPCRKEMPTLQAAYKDHRGRLPIVGVTYMDPASESRRFARKYGITFPLTPDDGIRVANAYGVGNGVPMTFFIDAKGVVRERVFGIETRQELDQPLNRLLAD